MVHPEDHSYNLCDLVAWQLERGAFLIQRMQLGNVQGIIVFLDNKHSYFVHNDYLSGKLLQRAK